MPRKATARARSRQAIIRRLDRIKTIALDLGSNRDYVGRSAALQVCKDADYIVRVLSLRH